MPSGCHGRSQTQTKVFYTTINCKLYPFASTTISKDELEARLYEPPVGARGYTPISLVIRFESDDSKAEQAMKNFKLLMEQP